MPARFVLLGVLACSFVGCVLATPQAYGQCRSLRLYVDGADVARVTSWLGRFTDDRATVSRVAQESLSSLRRSQAAYARGDYDLAGKEAGSFITRYVNTIRANDAVAALAMFESLRASAVADRIDPPALAALSIFFLPPEGINGTTLWQGYHRETALEMPTNFYTDRAGTIPLAPLLLLAFKAGGACAGQAESYNWAAGPGISAWNSIADGLNADPDEDEDKKKRDKDKKKGNKDKKKGDRREMKEKEVVVTRNVSGVPWWKLFLGEIWAAAVKTFASEDYYKDKRENDGVGVRGIVGGEEDLGGIGVPMIPGSLPVRMPRIEVGRPAQIHRPELDTLQPGKPIQEQGDRLVNPIEIIPAAPIRTVTASYGLNCVSSKPSNEPTLKLERGNATVAVRARCDGRESCVFVVRSQELGDPMPGCKKDFRVEWRCGSQPFMRRAIAQPEAGLGSRVELKCSAGR